MRFWLPLALTLVGCTTEFKPAFDAPTSATATNVSAKMYSAKAIQFYAASLSSTTTGHPLTDAEIQIIKTKREGGLDEILRNWTENGFLSESARLMTNLNFTSNGTADGIDYNLPGNLVKYVVDNRLPYSQILKADYCVDGAGAKIACDTGAPFTAGILTTRAFMTKNLGRFNLRRAGKLLAEFACREYPMEPNIQIPIERARLIPMFQVIKGTKEQSFGNGVACYRCHSQFGAHAQFFVKFNTAGLYQANATGRRDPSQPAGTSFANLYESHLLNEAESASETSQMFGRQARNLREAAEILGNSDIFLECSVRKTMKYFLRLTEADARGIDIALIRSIVAQAKSLEPDPSLQTLFKVAFRQPLVIDSVLKQGEDQ